MTENFFDEPVASGYDIDAASMFESAVLDPAVQFLAELATNGAALELGIGTGRVALPLRAHGVPVQGIDLSPAMVSRLRDKPGADDIAVTIGDYATTRVDGTFRLVYLVFNGIWNLPTQDAQVACFRNAAAHLELGGRFVAELFVPPLRRLPPGERFQAFRVTPSRIDFDELDVATQALTSHHHRIIDGRFEPYSVPGRYAWPAELDLMARLAGMRLGGRWSDWTRTAFTADSTHHVSVWEKVGETPW